MRIDLIILASFGTIVFYSILAPTRRIFGQAALPVAAAVTLVGLLGFLPRESHADVSHLAPIQLPYQALFLSILCLVVVMLGVSLWAAIEKAVQRRRTDRRQRDCLNSRSPVARSRGVSSERKYNGAE